MTNSHAFASTESHHQMVSASPGRLEAETGPLLSLTAFPHLIMTRISREFRRWFRGHADSRPGRVDRHRDSLAAIPSPDRSEDTGRAPRNQPEDLSIPSENATIDPVVTLDWTAGQSCSESDQLHCSKPSADDVSLRLSIQFSDTSRDIGMLREQWPFHAKPQML